MQNLQARILHNNLDYIYAHVIDLIRSLRLQTVRERRDYFLCLNVQMYSWPHTLSFE